MDHYGIFDGEELSKKNLLKYTSTKFGDEINVNNACRIVFLADEGVLISGML